MGLRCLTVRVSKDQVRRLISNGYLSLESSGEAAYVAFALEAWVSDNLTAALQAPSNICVALDPSQSGRSKLCPQR